MDTDPGKGGVREGKRGEERREGEAIPRRATVREREPLKRGFEDIFCVLSNATLSHPVFLSATRTQLTRPTSQLPLQSVATRPSFGQQNASVCQGFLGKG